MTLLYGKPSGRHLPRPRRAVRAEGMEAAGPGSAVRDPGRSAGASAAQERGALRAAQAVVRLRAHRGPQGAEDAKVRRMASMDAESVRMLTVALGGETALVASPRERGHALIASLVASPRERGQALIASPRSDGLGAAAPVVGRTDSKNGMHEQREAKCRVFELLEALEAKDRTGKPDPDWSAGELHAELLPLLHAFDFLRHFDAADAVLLAHLSERVRVQRGHALFVQGDSDEDGVFMVLHGALGLHFHPADAEEQILENAEAWDDVYHGREAPSHGADLERHFGQKVASVGVGSVLGENALLDGNLQLRKPLATGAAPYYLYPSALPPPSPLRACGSASCEDSQCHCTLTAHTLPEIVQPSPARTPCAPSSLVAVSCCVTSCWQRCTVEHPACYTTQRTPPWSKSPELRPTPERQHTWRNCERYSRLCRSS